MPHRNALPTQTSRTVVPAIVAALVPILIWMIWSGRVSDLWGAIQASAVLGTSVIVYRYTAETQRLRELGEAQQELSREQQATSLSALELQRATLAATYRPMVVASFNERSLTLKNIGNGPALSVATRWLYQHSYLAMADVNQLAPGGSIEVRFDREASDTAPKELGSSMLIIAVDQDAGRANPWPELEIDYRDITGTKFRTEMLATRLGPMLMLAYGQSTMARPAGDTFITLSSVRRLAGMHGVGDSSNA